MKSEKYKPVCSAIYCRQCAQKLRKPVDFENTAKKKPFANIWCEETEFLQYESGIGDKK